MEIGNVQLEYKKNKDLRPDDIKALQEWVEKQPHIPTISEFQLIIFLHSCYWSMEMAKTTIEKYVTFRGAWRDFFANRNSEDPKLQATMEIPLITCIPTMTEEGNKIFFFKLMDPDSGHYVAKDVLKLVDMAIAMELRKGTFNGLVLVSDMTECSAAHVLKTSISELRRFLLYVQDALPVRLKAVHYILPGKICELFIPIIKPFVKKELLAFLHFHDSYDTLSKSISLDHFPTDVGGNGSSLKEMHENMKSSLIENADFFINEEKLISNETRRDRKPSYMDHDLGIGIEGSFKKLNFD